MAFFSRLDQALQEAQEARESLAKENERLRAQVQSMGAREAAMAAELDDCKEQVHQAVLLKLEAQVMHHEIQQVLRRKQQQCGRYQRKIEQLTKQLNS